MNNNCNIKPQVNFGVSNLQKELLNDMVEKQKNQLSDITNSYFCFGCNKPSLIINSYRCYYCNLWFCEECSKFHFSTDNGIYWDNLDYKLHLIAIMIVFGSELDFNEKLLKEITWALRTIRWDDLIKLPSIIEEIKTYPVWLYGILQANNMKLKNQSCRIKN